MKRPEHEVRPIFPRGAREIRDVPLPDTHAVRILLLAQCFIIGTERRRRTSWRLTHDF